jgi:hypothetical protein
MCIEQQQQQNMDISPTVFMDNNNMKDNNFRHSVASTATNTTTTTTSTQRLSVASSLEEDNTLAYCKFFNQFVISNKIFD